MTAPVSVRPWIEKVYALARNGQYEFMGYRIKGGPTPLKVYKAFPVAEEALGKFRAERSNPWPPRGSRGRG